MVLTLSMTVTEHAERAEFCYSLVVNMFVRWQVDWPLFLSGFDMCCKQGLGAVKLKSLFLVFVKGKYKHELLPGLQGEVDEDLTGFVTMSQLQDVFLICWLLMCHSRLENVQDSEVCAPFSSFLVSLPPSPPPSSFLS